jgi:HSP20 family protein
MTLIRRTDRLYPAFPSFFNQILNKELLDWNDVNYAGKNQTLPAVNIKETEDSIFIEVAAPGLKKDDFKINLDQNRLSISSERKEEKDEQNDHYTRKEFYYQSFQRYFNVPVETIDGDKISAYYSDGILNISLPKREEVKPKPAREIEIL